MLLLGFHFGQLSGKTICPELFPFLASTSSSSLALSTSTRNMFHEALIITSLSSVPLLFLYRPAVGWARQRKKVVARLSDDDELSVEPSLPPLRSRLVTSPTVVVGLVRLCGRWLAAWLVFHLLVLLALVRGISSGGGTFAPELDKWQVSSDLPIRRYRSI